MPSPAFPHDRLAAGERVLVHAHPHGRALVGPALAFPAVLGVAGYVAGAAGEAWPGWGPVALAVGAVALVGWLTVAPVVRARTAHLVVTTRRLLVREGVRRRNTLDVPLDRIVAVHARSTASGRLLGPGSLVVTTDTDGEVEFVDVPGAERVAALLGEQVERVARPASP